MSKIELMCALKGTVFDHEKLLENKPFTIGGVLVTNCIKIPNNRANFLEIRQKTQWAGTSICRK